MFGDYIVHKRYTFQVFKCSTLSTLTEISCLAKYCNNHKVAERRLFYQIYTQIFTFLYFK